MSRQSKSPKSNFHHSKSGGSSSNNEDLVGQVKSIVTLLYEVTSSRPHECEAYIPSARSAMAALCEVQFFREGHRYAEQVWILNGLQGFAFNDPDSGYIRDITEFCQTSWLRILRNFPDDVEILKGLGSNWLQRSQMALAQIHQEEGHSSSQGSSSAGTGISHGTQDIDYGEEVSDIELGSDPRRHGPLYVEARGSLQPAVDFYIRAVRSADANGTTTGELLASAAEAQMSLGNVTAPPRDERHFSQAIRYLRRAEAVPGYTLSVYMQQYLNDYGRYVS